MEIQRNSSRAPVFLQHYDSAGLQEELEAEGGKGAGVVPGLSLAAMQEEEEEEEEMTLEMFDNSSVQVNGRNMPHLSSPTCPYQSVFVGCPLLQFELDIEPRLKPSLIGGGAGGVNDSQDVSFSQTTKGMQPLKDSVSELEMMTRAGKPFFTSSDSTSYSSSHPYFPTLYL